MQVFSAVVIDVQKPTPDVVILRFTAQGFPTTWKAGQFVNIFAQINGQKMVKAYSIASPPSQSKSIELCVKHVPEGPVSTYLCSLKKKQVVEMSGPMGIFTVQPPQGDVLFAATGTGISALKPMIETLFEQGTDKQVYLFFGAKAANEIVYQKEFEAIAKAHKNFHFIPVVSRDPTFKGEQGHVQDVIPKYVKNPKKAEIYICGVLKMVEETIAWAEQYGFEKRTIHFEKYI